MRPTAHSVLEALQAAGAVDGCTGRADLSVDGIDWADYSKTLEAMFQVMPPASTAPEPCVGGGGPFLPLPAQKLTWHLAPKRLAGNIQQAC